MPAAIHQDLYNDPHTWDPADWQEYRADQDRARLAVEWLPAGVDSILDVGCGNGVYSNIIEPGRKKVGLDLSRAALAHVTVPRLQGDASHLPFNDGSFSATISMEMLEHLPQRNYPDALKELVRVSLRYILVTVPYNEKLEYSYVICPACQRLFHPYQHMRSFTHSQLGILFSPHAQLKKLAGIVPTERKLLPGIWNRIRMYLHRQGRHFPARAVCPQCGYTRDTISADQGGSANKPNMRRSLNRLWPRVPTFTWWMALYQRDA